MVLDENYQKLVKQINCSGSEAWQLLGYELQTLQITRVSAGFG